MGSARSQHLRYRSPPPQRAQINKGVSPAFEISQTRSVTRILKFSEPGRRATSWGHVRHCSPAFGGRRRSRALQTNSGEFGWKGSASASRHNVNPWPGPTTPASTLLRSGARTPLRLHACGVHVHTRTGSHRSVKNAGFWRDNVVICYKRRQTASLRVKGNECPQLIWKKNINMSPQWGTVLCRLLTPGSPLQSEEKDRSLSQLFPLLIVYYANRAEFCNNYTISSGEC